MKFKPEAGDFPLDQDSCKADYTRARELGRVRLGQRALYFSHLTWTGVLPLDQVERAYLRIEDVPVGMGCRRVPMVYGDNVFEKDGIRRDRTGDGEKTRCLCGKRGIFNRDGPAMGPQIIRQLE